jgi:hypothetical protein
MGPSVAQAIEERIRELEDMSMQTKLKFKKEKNI